MKVKVCGITRVEDALLAERLGADFIGFIFANASKRCVSPEVARQIIEALTTAIPLGVFVEQTDDEVIKIADVAGLKAVQIYRPVVRKLDALTMIEAIRVKDENDLQPVGQSQADYYLLDAYHESAYGGTGHVFDWTMLPEDVSNVFIAGGLGIDNVRRAALLRPFAIDVCSGVESAPGMKDEKKLRMFFEEISQC